MATAAWKVAAALFLVHTLFVVDAVNSPQPVTFVLTPLVDVLPGTALDAKSGAALQGAARVDVRNINRAISRYGSTFSIDDLARAILGLPDLDADQKARLTEIITAHGEARAEAITLQTQMLEAEAALLKAAEPLRRFATGTAR
jgi:hypothetical protein